MPHLKIFVACEKVIVDQAGPATLVSIFQKMNIQVTLNSLPEKAISPTTWALFSLWEMDPEDIGREFTQIIKFYAPDKELFLEFETPFTNTSTEEHQYKIALQLQALPIWTEGFAEATVALKGSDVVCGSYRFEIRYLHLNQGVTAGGATQIPKPDA